MKKNFINIVFLLVVAFVNAQTKNYYDFVHNYLYGVVDLQGKEIIEPAYDWKLYILDRQSPFIVLMSKVKNPLIFNTETGKSETLKYIAGASCVEIDKKDYIYAYNDTKAFLVNNKDLDSRLILSKKYFNVSEEGDYLIAYYDENKTNLVDVISKTNLKIVNEKLLLKSISSFKTDNNQYLYVVNQVKNTIFFDQNFKQISSSTKILNSFAEIQKFLLSKNKIHISEAKEENIATRIGDPPVYPHIDIIGDRTKMTCLLKESADAPFPIFSFAPKEYKINLDSYQNEIKLVRSKENRVFTYIKFFVDIKTKKVLLPEKYWKDINIEMITSKSREK